MKTLAAVVLLCFAMSAKTQPNTLRGISITPWHDAANYAVILTAEHGHQGDLAVVTFFYYVHLPQIKDDVLIHRTTVVELVDDVACMSDSIPVPANRVKWVDVTLVDTVNKSRFIAAELETREVTQ